MHLPFSRLDRLLRRGLKKASRHRFEEAAACLKAALDLEREDPRILLQYGLALSGSGRYEESVEVLERACTLHPADAILPLFLGRVHLDYRQPDRACEALKRSLEMDGHNLLARSYAALARWKNDSLDEGNEVLSGLSPIQSCCYEARLLARVEESFLVLRPEAPVESMVMYDEEDTGTFPLIGPLMESYRNRRVSKLLEKGARLSGAGRHEEELAVLEKALEIRSPDALLRKRLTQARKRVTKELQKKMKKGKEEDRPDLLYRTGCLYFDVGEYEPAREALEEYTERRSAGGSRGSASFPMQNALRMLCEIALARRQGRKAAETLEALRAMDPGHPYLHYLSGRCLLQENERPAALQAFERFSGKEPSFGRMRLRALVQEGR